MKFALLFLLAGSALQFDVTDARGKKPSGVAIEAGAPDADGWCHLSVVAKGKGDPVLIWPSDGMAKAPDGPEPIPAIVIQRGDEKSLSNLHVVAAIATPVLLGATTLDERARETGFSAAALSKAFAELTASPDAFAGGIGLLYANKPVEAADKLAQALRERQRQLTRMPSEIYPAAMLSGRALVLENKFDAAAVAFMAALKDRPSSEAARKARADALVNAGKPDAAEPILQTR
jgi:hypothetical protein